MGRDFEGCMIYERSLLMEQRGSPSNSVTAALAAVPCPDMPEAGQRAAAAADMRRARDAAAAPGDRPPPPFTSACTVSWTPGIPAGDWTLTGLKHWDAFCDKFLSILGCSPLSVSTPF